MWFRLSCFECLAERCSFSRPSCDASSAWGRSGSAAPGFQANAEDVNASGDDDAASGGLEAYDQGVRVLQQEERLSGWGAVPIPAPGRREGRVRGNERPRQDADGNGAACRRCAAPGLPSSRGGSSGRRRHAEGQEAQAGGLAGRPRRRRCRRCRPSRRGDDGASVGTAADASASRCAGGTADTGGSRRSSQREPFVST